jgi:molecular chaperone HtpG
MSKHTETFQFQAESKELLELMIHSIYTHKEIFLRELISNASDALDKLRVESITNPELMSPGEKLEIRLDIDQKARTLTVTDNGIGMSRDDLINHIGTIAKSGTREFIQKMKENKSSEVPAEMIGQFGVGFYSSFMAADKVSILTKKAGEANAHLWESAGDGTYSLSESEKENHGTSITLHLKPSDEENGLEDYTSYYSVSSIVKRYSDFINYPIMMKEEREEVERDADGKPKKDGKKSTVVEDKTLNSMKPIWARPQSEVTEEEYKEFYKHISHDWNEPLKTITYKAEGTHEFYSLLFIPSKAPFDFYYQGYKSGLSLYVKKVMIMEAFEELLPKYLRFMKGVVESSDLSLNISRETLQQDRHVTQMKKSLTKKILDTLQDISNNEKEHYLNFWKEFGNALKEGIISDFDNKEKLISLLLFQSSADPEKLTSLSDYTARMKEGQNDIYFLTGESRTVLENSPHLELLKDKGFEVLYLTEPIDELMLQYVTEFSGKKLKSASKGDIDVGTKEEKEQKEKEIKEKETELSGLLKVMQEKLNTSVKEVKLSSRLVSAPACLVGNDFDMSPYLERLLQKESGNKPSVKRVLELNPKHPLVEKLFSRYQNEKDEALVADYSELLLGYATLAEGSPLSDPQKFNKLVVGLMEKSL